MKKGTLGDNKNMFENKAHSAKKYNDRYIRRKLHSTKKVEFRKHCAYIQFFDVKPQVNCVLLSRK